MHPSSRLNPGKVCPLRTMRGAGRSQSFKEKDYGVIHSVTV
ncbi:mCG147648 [Mus musculus]|nr:mCG147648 [Mus musculus]